ncbi:MAG: winged helix-turn-helix domain-containing protein [Candidatus Bathyarchaeota archaeon]
MQRAILALDSSSRFKYRDRLTIIIDILNAVENSRKGRKKTQIMQSANLNYSQMKKYVSYLTDCGLITATKRHTYRMTNKGSEFLYFLLNIQKSQGIS